MDRGAWKATGGLKIIVHGAVKIQTQLSTHTLTQFLYPWLVTGTNWKQFKCASTGELIIKLNGIPLGKKKEQNADRLKTPDESHTQV